jgi:hypothetical protein
MGGRIGLSAAAGAGSLFWVELPLPRDDAAADLHVAASA